MSGEALPRVYLLGIRDWVQTGEDSLGNATFGWAYAQWYASGIAPGATEEPVRTNRDPETVAWTVYGPKDGAPAGAKSQVQLPGGGPWYEMVGRSRDWTMGPWENPMAGVVLELTKTVG